MQLIEQALAGRRDRGWQVARRSQNILRKRHSAVRSHRGRVVRNPGGGGGGGCETPSAHRWQGS